MICLPFQLHDFTRTIWVSAHAKAVWEPRLAAITHAFTQIEWLSVAHEVRPAALQSVSPGQLPDLTAAVTARGLVALPLTRLGEAATYSATPVALQEGQPWHYRVAVLRLETAQAWRKAYQANDDDAMGALLGFPECCRREFQRTWVEAKQVDSTWDQALRTSDLRNTHSVCVDGPDPHAEVSLELAGDDAATTLLRNIGVRAVPHMPCGFSCARSAALGQQLVGVGRAEGHGEAMDWLEEVLSWPVLWTAKSGIAEVTIPILKFVTRTDATAERLELRRRGTRYPDEGARGLGFPFAPARVIPLTSLKKFQAATATIGTPNEVHQEYRSTGVQAPETGTDTSTHVMTREDAEPNSWEDNGFKTAADMEFAHEPVVTAVQNAVSDQPGASVIDLGAGDGALLARLRRIEMVAQAAGVESDEGRYRRGRQRHRELVMFWGDLFDVVLDSEDPCLGTLPRSIDVVLFMPGRLVERPERSEALREWLRQRARRLVLYAYGDWLTKHGSLWNLVCDAGLSTDPWSFRFEDRRAGSEAMVLTQS